MGQRATNNDSQQRWLRVLSTVNEIIPPYACMELQPVTTSGNANNFFCAESKEGQVVYLVTKPTEDGAASQNPSRFVFNGPNRIEKKGRGRATLDFPCQALHDGDTDEIFNHQSCGPQTDSWYMHSNGWAFTALTHCPANGYTDTRRGARIHTMWVVPGQRRLGARIVGTIGGVTVSAGSRITPTITPENVGFTYEPGVTNFGFQPQKKARYLFGVQATVYASSEVARGTILRMKAYVYNREDATEEGSNFSGHRYHDLESIGTGEVVAVTAENVAFTGTLTLDTDQEFYIKNTSSVAITLESFQVWLELLKEIEDEFTNEVLDPVDG